MMAANISAERRRSSSASGCCASRSISSGRCAGRGPGPGRGTVTDGCVADGCVVDGCAAEGSAAACRAGEGRGAACCGARVTGAWARHWTGAFAGVGVSTGATIGFWISSGADRIAPSVPTTALTGRGTSSRGVKTGASIAACCSARRVAESLRARASTDSRGLGPGRGRPFAISGRSLTRQILLR